MNILTLTPVFPSSRNPTEGLCHSHQMQAIKKLNHDVTVVVCKQWMPETFAKKWDRYRPLIDLPVREDLDGIDVWYARYLHLPGYTLPWVTAYACARAILRGAALSDPSHFDLIHAHGVWPVGLAAPIVAKVAQLPFLVTCHIQDDPRLYRRRVGSALSKTALEQAAYVAVVGSPLKRFIRNNYPSVNDKLIKQIPHGFTLGEVEATPQKKNAKSQWGTILSIAHLRQGKGIELNIRALAQLHHSKVPWNEYVIIGDGPERPALEKLAKSLEIDSKVRFLGRLSHHETMQHLAASDIFSLPSWQEAFGVAYLEAMACGKPVIGCSGQGAEDMIRHQKNGLLVQPHDLETLVSALAYLLQNPDEARKLGMAGQSDSAKFSWERNAQQYVDLYERMCRPRVEHKRG